MVCLPDSAFSMF